MVSFVDHDQPDYAVDGRIVLANGLTANASDGQASDMFPAYWSPALRQYVNYDGHNGYDIGIAYQPVFAAGSGTVEYAGWNSPDPYFGYGQMILIDHHNGYVTLYGHLSKLEVHKGETVHAGQEIAISGTTGHSSGPHLHFTVFHNCHVTDPYGWTGDGRDPLLNFDGDRASYLWIPGHDPQFLNPPPGWPTYPSGLQIHLSGGSLHPGSGVSATATDRLLLLALPRPSRHLDIPAGLALARTEAAITTETQEIKPVLKGLKQQGTVSSYQAIPAAAAIWVRGTATAEELESVPGVASLSGVEPSDLEAAELGLTHAVLVQIGKHQVPSLWPVGFHSSFQPWRPIATVVRGDALVSGFTLPGNRVTVVLRRAGAAIASADTTADPETGGFVVTLHDATGVPIDAEARDTIDVASGGRSTSISIRPMTLHLHHAYATGKTVPGATVSIAFSRPRGSGTFVKATASDRFSLKLPSHITAGTIAVASVEDGAGDEEAVTGTVPGLLVGEDTGVVRGWVSSPSAVLKVRRKGQVVISAHVHPASDGAFLLDLDQGRTPIVLAHGDVLSLIHGGSHRSFRMPSLGTHPTNQARAAWITAPKSGRVSAVYTPLNGKDEPLRVIRSQLSGESVPFSGRRLRAGDTYTVRDVLASGDIVQRTYVSRQIIVRAGDGRIEGSLPPATSVVIKSVDGRGTLLSEATATGGTHRGRFETVLTTRSGAPVPLKNATQLRLNGAGGTLAIRVIPFAIQIVARGRTIQVSALPGTHLHLRTAFADGGTANSVISIDTTGHLSRTPTIARGNSIRSVIASLALGHGVWLERKAIFRSPTVSATCSSGTSHQAANRCGHTTR